MACLFRSAIGTFKDRVEDFVLEERSADNLAIHYQVQIPNVLRGLIIFLMNDLLDEAEFIPELITLNQQLALLLESFKEAGVFFERYLIQLSRGQFEKIVRRFQLAISEAWEQQEQAPPDFEFLQVLDHFFQANLKREGAEQVAIREFYNDAINRSVNLGEQYEDWVEQKRQRLDPDVSYVNMDNVINFPWVLDCQAKSDVLLIDSRVKQKQQIDQDLINRMIVNPFGNQELEENFAYLYIKVKRETIIEDALNSLIKEGINFRKPLRVKFDQELGVDEGGVQKEFFQLLIRKLLDPDFSMFTYYEETRMHWFNGGTLEANQKFELIGKLMGIAIYNQNILELNMPMACYKKLLDLQPTLADLREINPKMAQSLEFILGCEDANLEESLYQPFTVEFDRFGETICHELVPDGREVFVSQENKAEYVYLLIDYIFNQQCEEQFRAFRRGFFEVVAEDILQLCQPEELELMVCGSKVLDFADLQKETEYVDGYTEDSPVVKWLWQIVHEDMTDHEKKKFLQFSTGCDRAPVGGLATLPFYVGRHGPDTDRLPTAHTCFNHLLIPEYSSKEKLKSKLLNAIQNAEGFGLY